MSKKEKQNETPQQEPAVEEQDVKQEVAAEPEETAVDPLLSELESLKDQVAGQEDKYLRLAAEYDNYRKRTAKEKESLWTDVKADTAGAFLPVYDNLERALKQDTADEAFKKGVEMTMNQLKEVLTKLGITEIPAQGQPFDPKYHNAVMHVEDESLGQNVVAEVFQTGFQCGEKVIRFAMVKVAN
ncbi:nucleotide exchange factor GrpE [Lawsonibacter sp. DFI.6.74]|uniref:Protein GrpE n=1 Tax=Flintibacter faecis TaxID=2763047 RepID=A0A8J6MBD8_9FIRM|nr:nucleotide exchange factor GrpE [Flintibacter faecis]MBC5717690.1 nucleotide exchange factor GrpE [Flintibacter faecis]MCG4469704.1 nucleotide exchange factor GrpE [Lawsonibacter sp. DFI.6.74]MCG4774134.1 nucleotide exchange factor GrpE [Lawsonibacter sp. DFI.5.51]